MQSIFITDANQWNNALVSIPYAHVLQSWAWGEIKARHGWTPTRVLLLENGAIVAAAQILRRPLPRTPFGVLYVPKGPALNFDNAELFARVLAELENIARQQRAVFIKIDPDIRVNQPAAEIPKQRAWRVSDEQIQFHNTVTCNLARSEQEILAAMKPKWRYNIRLAERKGVTIERPEHGAWSQFYEMYAETSARDGFLIRPLEYYRDVWTTMHNANQAQVFFARVGDSSTGDVLHRTAQNDIVAGLILFWFGRRAWYFYGASRSIHRDLMPNHLLQWEAMRWAKAQGCTEYDFWGAPDALEETAPMYGVYKFKMGFGGEFVERLPAHDFVVNRALYWLYAVARPRYLARLRKLQSSSLESL
ncbi:MAG: peptidoglycan bridge formation glycyltransferase FemA/FemB family protein [Chloroflexi bacterium]|nr:peptidoglycan bridge formation glycyltransferase FemA/FemB family protein [Chloroflexota bacterium]